ncbi:alanine racemase [Actinomycetaceae bacterium MB13-C1-2]|nr:alanine racemase [Actinomycetaceae bacterium MB13-C1-2]
MIPSGTDLFPAELDVDLDALAANAHKLKEYAGEAELLAVVKANGYGFGRYEVASRLWHEGVHWFGVSKLPEALALRKHFTSSDIPPEQARILTWLETPTTAWVDAVESDIDVSVSDRRQLGQVVSAVRSLRSRGVSQDAARVHLKIDVGMGRGGATLDDLPELARAVRDATRANEVELVGFWSHLSCADDPEGAGAEVTQRQIEVYQQGLEVLALLGLEPEIRHLAATSGTIWHPGAHFDMVRPGIGLYGYSPSVEVASSKELGLRPVGVLRTPIIQVKRVDPGHTVSYGATWTSPDRHWIGLLPIGYADGIPRQISNQADFLIETQDERIPTRILGRVCMDQMVIDLGAGEEPTAVVGDSVILFGDPVRGEPSADNWADLAETINYEIISRLPEHIDRRYHPGVAE